MAGTQPPPTRAAAQLKTPKGTRDWVGRDLLLRDKILLVFFHVICDVNFILQNINCSPVFSQTVSNTCKLHGGVPLDTPVFELREILSEKYGEDSRLIYNVEDQGGELCSLRYDLTVPFARWLAMHSNVKQIKRYQIAKVYRRDQPAIARGRLREFYQCDFDIAGTYDPMIPDAEILSVIVEVFRALDMKIKIKLNHRSILDGLFSVAGVPPEKTRAISSAVDKLDKMPWEEVKKEMLEKGLTEAVADQVGIYVQRSGNMNDIVDILKANTTASANKDIESGIKAMETLASYLKCMDVLDYVSFDLSLARGLDYYTGVIFEVVYIPSKGAKGPETQVGSLAAGGRYDNLVGMFGKQPIPCIGVSFGVDRIYTLLDLRREKQAATKYLRADIDVYIMSVGGKGFNGLLQERMAVARQLWDAGITAEFSAKVKPKITAQFTASEAASCIVILGEDELAAGQVRIKDARLSETNETDGEEKDRGRLIPKESLVEEVKKILRTGAVR